MRSPGNVVKTARGGKSQTADARRGSEMLALHPRARSIFEKAVKSRLVEESLLDLFSLGKLHGTVHTCIGQELSGAVITEFLRSGDTIFSNHRCHGHFVSRNDDIEGLIAELMGRKTGVCGGLGGSQHLYKDGFFSNGLQGGIVPVAAGLALGHKIAGAGNVSVVFIGDGTLGEGVVYEAFNIASKWSLPLLVVLEDNGYSQSTEQHETLAGDIDARAAAFGIDTATGSTWDWPTLCDTAEALIEQMRIDGRPRFLRIETYRLRAHSKGDDTRPREVVEPFEARDPLNRFLQDIGAEDAIWVEGARQRIQEAIAEADGAPAAELPAEAQHASPISWSVAELGASKRMVGELNAALRVLMGEHDGIFLIGEDILSPYGGAFKATNGLSDEFPGRVRNAPISEACIVGIGAGLGLLGYYPIVEIMFGDFIGLAFDQIVNHAAKFRQMYNGQVTTNLIVRTPMGGGRGYGPTHSQTLDRHFLGVPGLRIVALNSLTQPEEYYRPLITPDSGPTLVIENKLLYGSYLRSEAPLGFEVLRSSEKFPTLWIRPASDASDLTLIGYGGTGEMLIEACNVLFEEHDLIAQAIIVGQIYPFDVTPLIEPIGRAPRLIIVEEGQGFAGFGAEVVSQLAEAGALDRLIVRRVSPPAHCIPSSGPLEKETLPNVAKIVEIATRMASL
jgi:2-oxoisovalerate dehydrogenase E1 component